MSRYEFTKDLETGNQMIDREHRELIQAVNKLLAACSEGKGRASMDETIKFLNNYVNQHFSHEEQLQKRTSYPGYAAHRAFHEGDYSPDIGIRSDHRGAWKSEQTHQCPVVPHQDRG